jgi:hypothetical protein
MKKMKKTTQLLFASAIAMAFSAHAFAGGTITNGTATLQFVGNPIFSAPNGDANLTFPGVLDQQSRYTWYYRTAVGTNNIFSALDTPVESYSGNTATITYTNAGPGVAGVARFDAKFTITLNSSASGVCVVNTTLVFTASASNTSTQTFSLFHIIGFDLAANGQPDVYHVINSSGVSGSISDTGSSNFVQFRGDNATRYEFNLGSTLNSEAGSGLNNFATGAGTTASDFSSSIGGAGMQFTRTLAPGQSATITTSYALNRPTQLAISSITRGANGHALLQCMGQPNQVNNLQVSPDLSPGNFMTLSPAPPAADLNGAFTYDDAGAVGLTTRFYRLAFP